MLGFLERETRIELATNSLEGCDSTIELLPPAFSILHGGMELHPQESWYWINRSSTVKWASAG